MQLGAVLTAVGAVVLVFGLFSRLLRRAGVPVPLVVLALGVVLGPEATGILRPEQWGDARRIVEETMRVALAIGLMGVALRIPPRFVRESWRSIVLLLALGMPFMWLCSSLLAGLLLGVSVWTALLLGAVVAPTDPVVASTIVTGEAAEKNLPERLRDLLSAESGFNDGLALPFVLLPVFFLTKAGDPLQQWATRALLWEVGAALLLGAALGVAAGRLLSWAERRRLVDEPSLVAYTTALALLGLGAALLLRVDGLLAVFVAGLAFDRRIAARERMREERVVEGIDLFFTIPAFGLLGLVLPWDRWADLGAPALALVAGVLFLRRLPLLLAVGGRLRLRRFDEVLFAGWFGPLGVAALFYAALAARRTGDDRVWVVATLLVASSIVVHGLTAGPFTWWLGRRARRRGEDTDPRDAALARSDDDGGLVGAPAGG